MALASWLFAGILSGFSQTDEIDSLKMQLDTTSGQNKVYLLNKIAYSYWTVLPDTGLMYARKALELANQINFKYGIAVSYESMGTSFWSRGNADSALHYYLLSNKVLQEFNKPEYLISSYGNIGNIYKEQGFLDDAFNYYYKALENIDQAENELYHSYYGVIYNMVGEACYDSKQFDKALYFFSKGFSFEQASNETDGIINAYNNMANALIAKKKEKKAMVLYEKALALAVETKNNFRIVNNALALGNIFLKKNDIHKADIYIILAYNSAQVLNSKNVWTKIYEAMANLTHKQKKFEESLLYFTLKGQYTDSLQKEKVAKLILTLDKQKQQADLEELKLQNEKSIEILRHRRIVQLIMGATIVVGLFVILYFFLVYRKTKKSEGNLRVQKKSIEVKKNQIEEVLMQLTELSEIGQKVIASLSAQHIVRTVYEQLNKLFEIETFGIGVFTPEDNKMWFRGVYEQGQPLPDFAFQTNKNHLACWCYQNQQAVLINSYRNEYQNYIQPLSDAEIQKQNSSIIYIPVTTSKSKIGVVTIQNKKPYHFSQNDFSFLQNVALYIGIALENATAYEMLSKEIDTRDQLFSIISHDLRSPIGAIYSLTDFTLDTFDEYSSEGLKRNIELINTSSESALSLLETLLMWAKQQSKKIVYEPEIIRFSDIGAEIRELNKTHLLQKQITLECFSGNNIEIFADKNMLKTILRNLISNAIKFTKTGGKIGIKASDDQQFVYMAISDTGVGMTQQQINNLFDFKTHHTTSGTNNESGTGLGFILAYQFAQNHGGTIKVESKVGEGSTFTVVIPKPNN